MQISTLLADPEAIRLTCIRPSLSASTLVVKTTASQAPCPRCQRSYRVSTAAISDAWLICPGTESRSSWNCVLVAGVVTRDRSKTYARAVAEGAPSAVQVADRWHLLKNLREALEQLLKRVLPARGRRMRVAAHQPEDHECAPREYAEQSRVRLLPHLLRRGSGCKRAPPVRPPPPREAAWMLLQHEKVTDEKRAVVERLCQLFPELKAAQELALDFAWMVRQRAAELLPAWLRAAARSKLTEFVGFAKGVSEDYEAVKNALRYEWSNGQLEGQVNRLKLIKREMYGRAKFDLLRARVLHST